ncbi:ABC transporter permease [Paenibacillus sp. YPG26]|uniref:ABC transporter permease n=1 Tax=Paenibacillus sp. YPG26 TaxID=2878915 RepID=UPI002042278A|nr:ABC transporter permease [Paenibacillus sp. YPG26]USB33514.1 ABC transporter permease [Paenibacillus sp. YPG26]
MYLRIIRNDIVKSKLITGITITFVAAAAMLVALAVILTVNLAGAIDTLMTKARTPHFMQMHTGDLNTARLAEFAKRSSHVDQFQVLEFLNMDGAQIRLGDRTLVNSVQDHGLSTQSGQFDYLLDLDGKVIHASDGELYVPLSYMKDGTTKVGDRALIGGKAFTVAGFLRDSQMNSSLSSSKRFLVSRQDFADITELGHTEYLIEFRLKDLSALGAFEAAYASAGLEANGPTMTYPLFKMINAISDGIMIGVILLIGALVVLIALLCIRFTLLARIEEDYRELGVMKAIGLRGSDIRRIYLAKYAAIAAGGSLLGFALSILLKGTLLENIRLYMGESEHSSVATALGIIGALLVFLAIMVFVSRVLRRLRGISPAEAIRFGISQEQALGTKRMNLSGSRLLNTNIFLGVRDVLARRKLYLTMLSVLIISSFILLVPQNLYHTISSRDFIEYMGVANADMRIDLQQTDGISTKAAEITQVMNSDPAISRSAVLTNRKFQAKLESGRGERLSIELGDHSLFPVRYSEGRAPAAVNEIALSAMNAKELGKKVGDVITLVIRGGSHNLKVSGVYPDITNGGRTAKAVFTDTSADVMGYVIYAKLAEPSLIGSKVAEYADRFEAAKVSDLDEYIAQTFGSAISSVGKAAKSALIAALLITALVTLLFMKMLVAKDRYSIAVMKAFGFTSSDIRTQYAARSVFVLMAGIVLGTLLANTVGEKLAGAVISSFGASAFHFTINPLTVYLLSPLMMTGSVLIATILGTSGARHIRISGNIKE